MKKLKILVVSLILMMLPILSFADKAHDGAIYAKIFDDKNACRNGLPIVVVAPRSVENHSFMSAIFIFDDGKNFIQNSLAHLEDLDGESGFFFCSDEISLGHISLTLNYGYDQCVGFIQSFHIENIGKA